MMRSTLLSYEKFGNVFKIAVADSIRTLCMNYGSKLSKYWSEVEGLINVKISSMYTFR